MVLNRFLLTPEVEALGVARVEETGARVGLVAVERALGFALFVVALSTSFVGTDETGLLVDCFFSVLAVELRVDLRSLVDGVVLPLIDLLVFAGLSEPLLLGAADSGFLFSDSEPVPTLLSSSVVLEDRRSFCSFDVGDAGAAVLAGRADLAVTVGRVGGLLSPTPGVAREATGLVLPMPDDVDVAVAAAGRFDVVKGRFGGAVGFLVGFTGEPSVSVPFAFSLDDSAASFACNGSGSVSVRGVSIE